MGHGDAFFSISMALLAVYETSIYNVQSLGNLMDWFADIDPDEQRHQERNAIQKNIAKMVDGFDTTDENLANSGERQGTERTPEEILAYVTQIRENAPNPSCTESLCNSSYWVKERNLCLYCGHRG